jgi:hypothetical protein
MNHPARRPILALVAVLAVLLGPALRATAAEPDPTPVTWGVAPAPSQEYGDARANYGYQAEPGQVIHDALMVSNHGDESIALRVYAADGFTTASGALDLLPFGEKSVDLGSWVVPDRDRVRLPPGKSVRIGFTMTVPEDATPGDHTGGIVTSLVVPGQEDGITVDRRLGSRIHTRVLGGLTPALEVTGLTASYDGAANPAAAGTATVRFRVTNTGNVRASAEELVTVAGPFGLGKATATGTIPELLPGDHLDVETEVTGVRPLVRLAAKVALTPVVPDAPGSKPAAVAATADLWAVPWVLIVGLLALLLLLAVARVLRRRRAAREEHRVVAAVEQALRERQPLP